jgi:hypothetical protein
MYRDSVDTLAREIARLRAENDQLRVDWLAAQQIVRPRRVLRWARRIAVMAILAVTGWFILAYGQASVDARSRRALNETCWSELREAHCALASARSDTQHAIDSRRDIEAGCKAKLEAFQEAASVPHW